MPDALICGNWTIPYDTIEEAVLYRTSSLFIPCYVLRIKAFGVTYQFGLNPNRFWKGDLPFPVRRETMRLGYSWFSIIVRVVAVVAIVYWLWNRIR